jgi:creatinine amidohydrolase
MRCGFRRIVLLNWHFENANFVYEGARLAHERARAADARIMVVEAAFAELSPPVMDEVFGDEFAGWDKEHAAVLETSLMLHLRPETVLFDRAVDDEAQRHPFWDVIPTPADFVPASGGLWKATRSSSEKGALAWREIVANLEAAIREELAPYSPMSSSQTSGLRAMNDASTSTHSDESKTTTSTPA